MADNQIAFTLPGEPAYPVPAVSPGCGFCGRSDVAIVLPMGVAEHNVWRPPESKSGICLACCQRGMEILMGRQRAAGQHDWIPLYQGADVDRCTRCPVQRRRAGDVFYQHRMTSDAPEWKTGELLPMCRGS